MMSDNHRISRNIGKCHERWPRYDPPGPNHAWVRIKGHADVLSLNIDHGAKGRARFARKRAIEKFGKFV